MTWLNIPTLSMIIVIFTLKITKIKIPTLTLYVTRHRGKERASGWRGLFLHARRRGDVDDSTLSVRPTLIVTQAPRAANETACDAGSGCLSTIQRRV